MEDNGADPFPYTLRFKLLYYYALFRIWPVLASNIPIAATECKNGHHSKISHNNIQPNLGENQDKEKLLLNEEFLNVKDSVFESAQ